MTDLFNRSGGGFSAHPHFGAFLPDSTVFQSLLWPTYPCYLAPKGLKTSGIDKNDTPYCLIQYLSKVFSFGIKEIENPTIIFYKLFYHVAPMYIDKYLSKPIQMDLD